MIAESSRPRDGVPGVVLVVTSAVAYGTVPIVAKLAFAAGVTLPELLSWRFAIAAVLLWIVAATSARRLPNRSQALRLFALGAVGYAGQSAAFFAALQRIPAATCALLLYTYPAIVTIGATIFFHDRLGGRKIAAILIAFAGTSLLVQGQVTAAEPAGAALALLSAVVYSAYVLIGSRLFAGVPPIAAAGTILSSTAVSFATFAAATQQLAAPAGPAQWALIGTIAVVGTGVPVLAFVAGMPRIGPSRASILSTFEPAVTVLLATAILAEPLHPLQIAGAVCILFSVAVLESGKRTI